MKLSYYVSVAGCLAGIVATAFFTSVAEAESPRRLPTITKPKFDPDAEKVAFFEATKAGTLEAWLIPENEAGGFVFIENKSDVPLTVKMPAAFVGVQNLKQFLNGNGNGNNNIFGPNNQQSQNQGATGGNQSVGGGTAQTGNNNNGFQLNGNNNGNNRQPNNFFAPGAPFFSIPPQRRVKLQFNSVCLNHGLKTPSRRNRYHLVSVDDYTNDEQLKELLTWVATGKVPQKTAQAATWHLTDEMSYQQLAAKKEHHLGGAVSQFFSRTDIRQSKQLVEFVDQQIAQRKKEAKNSPQVASGEYSFEK